MGTEKIGKIEAIFLILSFIINLIILSLPRIIISTSGSASIINTVYISIIALIIVLLIYKLLSAFPGQDVLDISLFLGGKSFKIIVGSLFIIFFLFTAFSVLKSFSETLNTIYYYTTPPYFVTGVFCIIIAYACSLGFKAISRANVLILPLSILSIFLLLIFNMRFFTFERIFPILGYGINETFFSGLQNLVAFGNIAIIYFLPSILKDSNELKKASVWAIIWSSICLFISVLTILLLFSYIGQSHGIMPFYLASREIEFGRFFQRLDAVFILIWTISIVCFLSILVLLAIKILKNLTNIQNSRFIAITFSIILFIAGLIPKNIYEIFFIENSLYKNFVILFIFIFNILILLFANFKKLNKEAQIAKKN